MAEIRPFFRYATKEEIDAALNGEPVNRTAVNRTPTDENSAHAAAISDPSPENPLWWEEFARTVRRLEARGFRFDNLMFDD